MSTINFYNMDCNIFMKDIPDKYYDLAIVDPPYGIGMDNSNKRTKPDRPNSYTKYPEFRYHKTDWDKKRVTKECVNEIIRISKNQIMWGANYYCNLLPDGFGWIFWNKKNGLNNCFSDGEFAFTNKGVQGKYFECSQFDDLNGGIDRIHPNQKPVKLYRWLLQNYAKLGWKIIDTHGGSLSHAIACDMEGFDLDICEIDKDYFDDGKKRFDNYKLQLKLF